MPDGTATSHLFRPKLATILSEGYRWRDFRHDAQAGLTVAIVALPLSMAIAVASGLSPDRGVIAAIVGGFLISALGGSRYQVGGPAGAFIVVVSATVASIGVDGLMLAILLSGILLTVLGALRIGALIRHMPHGVTVGFTMGIAITILASQLKDLGGLRLEGPEPVAFAPKLAALIQASQTLQPATLALGLGVTLVILGFRRIWPNGPGMLIAVVGASVAAAVLRLPVETIGGRFGGIPSGFPSPHLPSISVDLVMRALPATLVFTLLGAIESLLSAKVADGMTARRHRSNMELVAQGLANIASPMFGGMNVTGTIARTATNIRAGARSPIAGMLHAAFLLAFVLLAAPLARFVPLTALAGVLVVVAWNMVEKKEAVHLLLKWRTALILIATLATTLLRDLAWGVAVGCAIAVVLALVDRRATSTR